MWTQGCCAHVLGCLLLFLTGMGCSTAQKFASARIGGVALRAAVEAGSKQSGGYYVTQALELRKGMTEGEGEEQQLDRVN